MCFGVDRTAWVTGRVWVCRVNTQLTHWAGICRHPGAVRYSLMLRACGRCRLHP